MFIVENAILQEEYHRAAREDRWNTAWFWFVTIPLLMITFVSIWYLWAPASLPRQRVILAPVPDGTDLVAITQPRSAWEEPRVVAFVQRPAQHANPPQTKAVNPRDTGRVSVADKSQAT